MTDALQQYGADILPCARCRGRKPFDQIVEV